MRLLQTHFLPGLPRAAQWTFGLALLLLALGAPHTLYPTPWARTTALYVGASGLILLLLATVRVSRHLRETEALQKRTEVARQRFARVVEQTSEIVFITDARGTIDYVNHACEEATGYRAAELLGHKPSLFKSGLHDADFYLHLWGTLLGGHIFTGILPTAAKTAKSTTRKNPSPPSGTSAARSRISSPPAGTSPHGTSPNPPSPKMRNVCASPLSRPDNASTTTRSDRVSSAGSAPHGSSSAAL